MSNRLAILILLPLFFGSCIKPNKCGYTEINTTASSSEIAEIKNYLSSAGVTDAIQHPSGVFYKINQQGDGASPALCSTIVVTYNAYRFDNPNAFSSFSDPAGIPFVLGTLIEGIKKVLPVLKAGGSIIMYIPPSLAYGNEEKRDNNGVVVLPANSYIKFDMSLLKVQ